jgi:hypothetical protein
MSPRFLLRNEPRILPKLALQSTGEISVEKIYQSGPAFGSDQFSGNRSISAVTDEGTEKKEADGLATNQAERAILNRSGSGWVQRPVCVNPEIRGS